MQSGVILYFGPLALGVDVGPTVGVDVGPPGVFVGAGVLVGAVVFVGCGVFVGGTGVLVGGTGVFVGGTGVFVFVGIGVGVSVGCFNGGDSRRPPLEPPAALAYRSAPRLERRTSCPR